MTTEETMSDGPAVRSSVLLGHGDAELERLRAAQAHDVMPLIGPLLDAWEGCSQDVRSEHPELDKQLRRINRAMEDAGA